MTCIRNGIKREGEGCSLNNNRSYPYCGDNYYEPAWVCFGCAKERGARIPDGHCYTVHRNICGICGTEQEVTEPRDFGRTRYLLRVMKTLLFLLLVITASAQEGPGSPKRGLGGYATFLAETFYNPNFQLSVGLRYKESRAGFIQQQAHSPEGLYVRKGLLVEQGIGNVDKCAYFAVGMRVLTTNDKYVSVVPHFTMAIRFKRYLDVPITFSTFKSQGVASIGVRVLF